MFMRAMFLSVIAICQKFDTEIKCMGIITLLQYIRVMSVVVVM